MSSIQTTPNPFPLFEHWFSAIKATGIENPDAVNVSTIDPNGHPDSRMVLMRRFNERGFSFFTNYESPKSKSIALNPWGNFCFFWQIQEKQIRIQGVFEKNSAAESDEYWNSRPRESQLNAMSSHQSSPLSSREELEKRVQETTQEWEGKPLSRPAHWGGWRLVPWKFEFWLGHPYRLHDRVIYQRFAECPESKTLLTAPPGGSPLVLWTQYRVQP